MLTLARMLTAECSSVLYNRYVIGLALATGAALVSAGYHRCGWCIREVVGCIISEMLTN